MFQGEKFDASTSEMSASALARSSAMKQPDGYIKMKASPRVVDVVMAPLTAGTLRELLCSHLSDSSKGMNVESVADQVADLVESKCMGNPLFATELISLMESKNILMI